MKPFLYELFMIMVGFIYFIFIAVPLAISVLFIAHFFFTIKKIIKWIAN